MKDPGKVIPRSILISLAVIGVVYFAMNLSVIGVVPWREFVPAEENPRADFIVSIFMERVYGPAIATAFTLLVLWTTFGSVFRASCWATRGSRTPRPATAVSSGLRPAAPHEEFPARVAAGDRRRVDRLLPAPPGRW